MGLPTLPFGTLLTTRQLVSGFAINRLHDLLTSYLGGPNTGIIALAGGALTNRTPVLNAAFCEITVVASAADSVQLPRAKTGYKICITNNGANSVQVFGNYLTSDTVQGQPTATGQALAAGATAIFVCTKDTVWKRFISA